ncbi:MAG: hypothetical protein QXF24_04345, partial [Thermoproteota archaeon]
LALGEPMSSISVSQRTAKPIGIEDGKAEWLMPVPKKESGFRPLFRQQHAKNRPGRRIDAREKDEPSAPCIRLLA